MAVQGWIGAIFKEARGRADWPAAVEAIRAGAAYLAQGASYSYLRARTLLAGPRLFQDADFGFALTICKWEGFGVAAQDLILILEAELRDRLPVFLSRPPLKPDAISIATALRLLEHAPIEESVRQADKMMVVNNVAFRFIEYQAKLRRKLDLPGLAAELSARMRVP